MRCEKQDDETQDFLISILTVSILDTDSLDTKYFKNE